jgi:geranylgeranyl diphosphate synthase type II
LAVRRQAFERYFDQVVPGEREVPARLHAAMRHGALSPGKRLRPMLTLCACEAVGGDWQTALPGAAAVELVHAFSLVHDDLPAMDDDDFRRGRPTTHKKYGEGIAILAGDALLALAFQELCLLAGAGVTPKRVVEAVEWLAYAAGSRELVGGQVLDLEAEHRAVTEEEIFEIHSRKTGALMTAALQIGGLAGGASEARLKALGQAGRLMGVAFQIQDDLLNRKSSLARLGKRAGTDSKRGKATYPKATGEAAARARADELMALALGSLKPLGPRAEHLRQLIVGVADRDR